MWTKILYKGINKRIFITSASNKKKKQKQKKCKT